MNMNDKVIKGIKNCLDDKIDSCDICPYGNECYSELLGNSALLRDVLEVLKNQGPKTMTLEEVKQTKICWIEDRTESHDLLYPAIYIGEGNGGKYVVFLVNEDDDVFEEAEYPDSERWLEPGDISIFWRPWNSKPTPEQMENAAWEEYSCDGDER